MIKLTIGFYNFSIYKNKENQNAKGGNLYVIWGIID